MKICVVVEERVPYRILGRRSLETVGVGIVWVAKRHFRISVTRSGFEQWTRKHKFGRLLDVLAMTGVAFYRVISNLRRTDLV